MTIIFNSENCAAKISNYIHKNEHRTIKSQPTSPAITNTQIILVGEVFLGFPQSPPQLGFNRLFPQTSFITIHQTLYYRR